MVNRLLTKDHTGPFPDPYCKFVFFFQSILEPIFMEGITYTVNEFQCNHNQSLFSLLYILFYPLD